MAAPSTSNELRELRRFGFGTATGLTLLALAAYTGKGPFAFAAQPQPEGAVALACAALWVAGVALVAPRANRWLRRAVLHVAHVIALLTLLVFFFGVLTPVGVMARLAGHDPLALRPHSRRDSYWRPRRPRDKQSYFHQS